MRIAITGPGGFIGTALVQALVKRNEHLILLTRNVSRYIVSGSCPGNECYEWPYSHKWDVAPLDAVVNLAGETISGRWTPAKKKAIRDSRVLGARRLVEAISRLEPKPKVLVSASAVGYYGDRGEEELTEQSAPGTGFLPEVCVEWETEVSKAAESGIRVVMLRIAVVLDSGGGALQQMITPFKAGLGGPMGSGRQWFPWIHRTDLVNMILAAIDGDWSGPVNAASPGIVRQAEFAKTLGTALGRPAVVPAPGFALKALLGEFANTLLHSQKVVPAEAFAKGFKFQYPTLPEALAASVGKASA